MPDIVITPNRGTSTNPKIDFTGVTTGTIKLEVLTDGSLSFTGANGSLFSIADSVTGSLMSVNDISGLPILEVFSTDKVVMGKYGQNTLVVDGTNGRVGIKNASPAFTLDVTGSIRTTTGNLALFADYLYVSAINQNTFNSGYNVNGVADMWINYRGYADGHSQFRNFNVGDGKGANIAYFDAANKRFSINNAQSTSYTLDVNGIGYASTDFRAPIFYDSISSAYYCDPGSTSNLNALTLSGVLNSSAAGNFTSVTWGNSAGVSNGNARSLVIGFSGGNYGQIGYGISYTSTSGLHNYAINDIVSLWEAYDGIKVYAAAGSTVGTAITWTTVLEARRSNTSLLFKGNTVLDSSNYSTYVGNGTLTLAVSGTGLSGSASFTANQSGNTTFTVTSNATNANTASTIVARDGSGNFSAGTITATLSGNASTASTWQTARTLTVGNTGKSVNGSADVSWSLSEIGAYPSAGGTLSGNITFDGTSGRSINWGLNTDTGFIRFISTGNGAGLSYLEIGTTDDGDEPIKFTQSGNVRALIDTDGRFKANVGVDITGTLTISSSTKVTNLNADLLDGLDVHTGTNNEANKIVRTDGNGYIQAGWINTISGDQGTSAIDRVYASYDQYIRYYTPANFRQVLNVPQRDGTNASGTWGISITGTSSYISGGSLSSLSASAAPRTSTGFNTIRLFDNYNYNNADGASPNWPSQYGTVMEIYGRSGHEIDQLHFGNDRRIYHRSAFYGETSWTTFYKILESSDAASTNSAGYLVLRDGSGNFSAGTITAALSGNATTATTWQTARNLSIGGTSKSVNGSADVTWSTSEIGINNATLTLNVSGNGLSGSQTFTANQSTAATFTVTSNATSANTASTLVYRGGSGEVYLGDVYSANWFRTNGANGLYNSDYVMHFYSGEAGYYNVAGGGSLTYGGLKFRAGHASTFKGATYWDNDGFGLLNSNGNWAVRSNQGSAYAGGTLYGAWTKASSNYTSGITLPGMFIQSGATSGTPTAIASGDLWWNTDTGKLNIWWSTANAWVVATPTPDMSQYYPVGGGNINGNASVSGLLTATGNITAVSASSYPVSIGAHPSYATLSAIWKPGYDYALGFDNTSTYLNAPSGTVYFRVGNTSYAYVNGGGVTSGNFNGTSNSATLYGNVSSSYGAWAINGSRNSYGGIYDAYSGVAWMHDSGGSGGLYRETNGRWYLYHNISNNCLGIGGSSTTSGYAMQVNGGTLNSGVLLMGNVIRRTDHAVGFLEGSYNNVGSNDGKSNPIYTIGSSYNPTNTAISNMYGIGYSHSNFFGTPAGGVADWGLYVAAGGTISAIVGQQGSYFRYSTSSPIFYDSANTAYYCDPATRSVLNNLSVGISPGSVYALEVGGTISSTGALRLGSGPSILSGSSSTGFTVNASAGSIRGFYIAVSGTEYLSTSTSGTLQLCYDGSPTVASGTFRTTGLGVGTAPTATAGEIVATNNITAYYSDERLKTKLGPIENPIEKVKALSGFYFEANETAVALGYQKKREIGVSAQEVQAILPEIVVPAPISDEYLTVRYEKMIPLLIEAIKAQQVQIDELKALLASKA